jgi:hypothetical protein
MNIITGNWIEVRDGDPRAVALYRRHYSCDNRKADLVRYGFSGNGESMILMTLDCKALFCWRFQDKYQRDKQQGVNCSVFRNESNLLSSDLIKEGMTLAWVRWPSKRLYTYVNPDKIKSTNPGYCFIKAGWRKCGYSKGGLLILEISP